MTDDEMEEIIDCAIVAKRFYHLTETQRVIDAAPVLIDKVRKLKKMLSDVEWIDEVDCDGDVVMEYCPWCYRYKRQESGHATDCPWVEAMQ